MSWNDLTGTCTGFPTGLNIRFLVSHSGEKANPQNKIISAAYEYTSTPLKMRTPYSDQITQQGFSLTTTVSFVFKSKQELVGYQPPAPPLLFEVPYDAFYPFSISNSAPSTVVHGDKFSVAVMVAVAAIVGVLIAHV